jgi:hypothetical protein
MATLITFARGPFETGWIGWSGGLSIKKRSKDSADGHTQETRNPLRRMTTKEQKDQATQADVEKNAVDESGTPTDRRDT